MTTTTGGSRDRDLKQNMGAAGQMLLSISKPVVDGIVFVLPIAIQYTRTGYRLFNQLPHNCLHFMYGTVFCFFGGMYPTLFAAIQAAEHSGRETCIQAMTDLSNEITVIIEESKKDDIDMKQEKKGGGGGTDEVSNKEYVTRKTKLVLQKMNPEKVNNAISSMYGVWLSVAAVLSIEFARTISFALAISDFLQKPMDRFITPTVKLVTPNEYDKWVPVVMSWVTKSIAMSIAWKIQVRFIFFLLRTKYVCILLRTLLYYEMISSLIFYFALTFFSISWLLLDVVVVFVVDL